MDILCKAGKTIPANDVPEKGLDGRPFTKAVRHVPMMRYQHQGGVWWGCHW